MAFLVQNDEGTIDLANSYVSIAELDSYMTDRGLTTTKTDTEKEQAIVRATDFIDFNHNFIGEKTNGDDQTTEIPRTYCKTTNLYQCLSYYNEVSVDSGITDYIKKATFEYTISIMSGEALYSNIESDRTGVKKFTEKIGPISDSVEYIGSNNSISKMPKAEGFLDKSGLLANQTNYVMRS